MTAMRDPKHIAAAIDGFPEGRDAAVLAAALAKADDADVLLVTVLNDPLILPLSGGSWKELRHQAEANLVETRNSLVPGARTKTVTDISVARALERVAAREHRDLLVLGSSPEGPANRVRIGKRTRQLIGDAACTLAVAPRGLHEQPTVPMRKIAVGFDGGPESQAALAFGSSLARRTGAQLVVCSVVDNWLPTFGLNGGRATRIEGEWRELLEADVKTMRAAAEEATRAANIDATVDVPVGHPGQTLVEVSAEVDLMVVGSRRWGFVARVVLGSTGEALVHDAACPLVVVPRLSEPD
jgi:nucleotide-binding universal stress UspA family protein